MEPTKNMRHLVNLQAPTAETDPTETINKVLRVSRMAPFGGHTIRSEEGARIIMASSQNFANILQLEADARYGSIAEFAAALDQV